MAYAEVNDIEARLVNPLSDDAKRVCAALLDDAAVIIDAYNTDAQTTAKKIVSCRMVIRALGAADLDQVPIGATQGSMSALGYTQSWTISSAGSVGELYLSKLDKKLLGSTNSIGASNPFKDLIGD